MLRAQTFRQARRLASRPATAQRVASLYVPVLQQRGFQTSYSQLENQQSPMKVFVDTFKKEWKKSAELDNQIKQLKSATDEIGESEAFKRAREAYSKAQEGSGSIAKTAAKAAEAVGDAATKAWDSPVGKGVRKTVEVTADAADKVMEPVRQTQTYKDVKEVFNEGSSAYGLYESKEERLQRRERAKSKEPKSVKADEEAGTAVIATDIKPAASIKDKLKVAPNSSLGKVLATLNEKWEEADNPLLVMIRSISHKISGIFAETENAKVVKAFKAMDPNFTVTKFGKQLREYIVPEVLDAYETFDEKTLKMWLSEAPFNIISAQQKQLRQQDIFSDGRILDIRGVDVVAFKLLEPNQTPVLVTGSRVQEIVLFRNAKTGEVVAGSEEDIVMSSYAMVLTRVPEEMDNPETDGWKVLEFVKAGSRTFT
ncbi:DEKNAAC102838 [Brettanomyces naardenensis]|uniref:Mitochondrial import inner membrane translocase subunit TIM44 n=1 Tax=Brettanomyces naardenensis TaxID=13370 RepID=A0A448YLS0_BRENA|nr:DEKNAAC102838 [Brettanomyces naardenensis]